MSCLAEVFEAEGALEHLEAFTSLNGPDFYGLPANEELITLTKGAPVAYPTKINSDEGPVSLFDPGFPLHWVVQ